MKTLHLSSPALTLTLKSGLREVYLPVNTPLPGDFMIKGWQFHARMLTLNLFGLKFIASTHAGDAYKPRFIFQKHIWVAYLGRTSFTLIWRTN